VVCCVSPVARLGEAGASLPRTHNEGASARCVEAEDAGRDAPARRTVSVIAERATDGP
jgi:hypothetical protein